MTTPYSSILHTPRLTITLSTPADLEFRHQLFIDRFEPNSAEAKKWTIEIVTQFLAQIAINHLKSAPNGPPHAAYIVRLNPTPEHPEGHAIGGINYFCRVEGTVPGEIGFSFLQSHQRMGFGVEAIGEVVRHLRECGIKEIYACTMEDNIGCQKTLKTIGFVNGGFVEMQVVKGEPMRLPAFVLPGMKDLEGQKLTWVGSTLNFGKEEEKEEKKEE